MGRLPRPTRLSGGGPEPFPPSVELVITVLPPQANEVIAAARTIANVFRLGDTDLASADSADQRWREKVIPRWATIRTRSRSGAATSS
jgi:hypothetical protein